MIGLIVTGHGNFASGLTSSLKLIEGNNLNNYEFVDFEVTDSVEVLEEKLNKAFDSLKDCDGILVLCDLIGGSPFKSATIIGGKNDNVEIVAGTNLPMLIEVNMLRQFQSDLKSLTDQAIEAGKSMISKYVYEAYVEEEPDEGI
ncbi:PTS galactosamine/N-acetylgalactosamine transporter subunit IIA [Clostridium sp. HCS.1]|uniref:PTS galactosamine/N-acetylgalactosamine transporter subunit IIA n=1 Tax=Clostridium sp. HCS.1 TaxID=3238594 RepID=UPI003A100E60